jgi:hypothetical protein
MKTKTILAATAMFVTAIAPPASANDIDKGVAGVVLYGGWCDPNDMPENIVNMTAVYMKTHKADVEVEIKELMRQIYSVRNLDNKTAENMWCSLMRPKLLKSLNNVPDEPSLPIPAPAPAPKKSSVPTEKTEEFVRQQKPVDPPPPPPKEITDQAERPVAPPTLPLPQLPPLSQRLAEINNLTRQSLPIITRHCGKDATCRQQQTAAMQELAGKEIAIAKALRDPTSYGDAIRENDTVNACEVMWRASEDFVGLVQCINDATPPVAAEAKLH